MRDRILKAKVHSAKLRSAKHKSQNPRNFASQLQGATVTDIQRRGKHLLIHLSGNLSLWCHLGMTGQFIERDNNEELGKHDHAHFVFVKGKSIKTLVFRDVRKFGHLRLVRTDELFTLPEITKLGPEPLEIKVKDFIALYENRKRIIKPALLDQHIMVGIGNIYADESLYACGLHPQTPCDQISKDKLIELHKIIQKILMRAIKSAGSTIDNYSGVNGEPGSFQSYLKVYGRQGEPCSKCGATIIREVIAGRSAHYCKVCQKV